MSWIGNVACLSVVISLAVVEGFAQPTLDDYYAGQALKAQAAAAKTAKLKKMAAVDKVIAMMKSLRSQVLFEGSSEATSYDKFACFCKDTEKAKGDAISEGTTRKDSLTATILSETSERDTLVTDKIEVFKSDIEQLDKDMKQLTQERAAANAVYTKDEKDVSEAIDSLVNAIQVLKASKMSAASLVQVQSISKTLKTAIVLADALGLIQAQDKEVSTLLLQTADGQPEVEMENYKFKSGGIIETLEKLLKEFKDTKETLDKEEVRSVQTYNMEMQQKSDEMKAKQVELTAAQAKLEDLSNSIGQNSEELTVVSGTLTEDQQYLVGLVTLCNDKGSTYDQRVKLRSDELTTLTKVIDVLVSSVKTNVSANTVRLVQQGPAQVVFGAYSAQSLARNKDAMQALEAAAEAEEDQEGSVGFLQRRQVRKHNYEVAEPKKDAREVIGAMLSSEGIKLRSTALAALATEIQSRNDPFKKVRDMIEAYLDKLLTEEVSEASSKNTCDKDIETATWKRDESAGKVMGANANLESLEAKRDSLAEQVNKIEEEILELQKEKNETKAEREQDYANNAATIMEAKAGLAAIKVALETLSHFYAISAKAEALPEAPPTTTTTTPPDTTTLAPPTNTTREAPTQQQQATYISLGADHCKDYSGYKRWCKLGVSSCGDNSQGPSPAAASIEACQQKCNDQPSCVAMAFKSQEDDQHVVQCITYEGACRASGDSRNWGFQYYVKATTTPTTTTMGRLFIQKQPMIDAPDAGFDNFEAYTGAQAESGGIIGMMDVIRSDFERTIKKTTLDEARAKDEFVDFTKDNEAAVLQKTLSAESLTKLGNEAKASILKEKDILSDEMKILEAQVQLLMTYKVSCIDTGMKYDERVAIRAQEIEDLRKALCILENYMAYGDDAVGAKPC